MVGALGAGVGDGLSGVRGFGGVGAKGCLARRVWMFGVVAARGGGWWPGWVVLGSTREVLGALVPIVLLGGGLVGHRPHLAVWEWLRVGTCRPKREGGLRRDRSQSDLHPVTCRA